MTLLGKILTVLIFIMSIVFMSLSLMVFATHKNWKLVVSNTTPGQTQGLVQQLQQKTSEVENLNNQLGRLKDQYAAEQVARSYALSALSTKLTQLEQQLQQRETELTNLQGAHTEQTAALQTLETNNNRLLEEVAKLRDSVRVAQNDRDSQFLKVVELTDQLNSAIGVERSLKEKREQLVEQVAQMKRVMDANGLTINVDTDAIPPKIDGVVLAIGGKDLLEISLGSDSGLKAGHEMEVYRGATYLGRVIVVKAEPNRAVARILPEYRKGSIKKDDRVTTRLG
ncbi:MAG: hypothetical protein RLY70_1727 [Planctomycetota bacterium]|jgi:hypothetical protein